MIRITLTREDLYKVLEEKFGAGHFVLHYIESDAHQKAKHGDKELESMTALPRKEAYVLHIDP